jgi:hypothetical protein
MTNDIEILYHITIKEYSDDILKNGLNINIDKREQRYHAFTLPECRKKYIAKYGLCPIFLTIAPQKVKETQIGSNWKKLTYIILSVDVRGLLIESEYDYLKLKKNKKFNPYSTFTEAKKHYPVNRDFICKENISPNRITFFSTLDDYLNKAQ